MSRPGGAAYSASSTTVRDQHDLLRPGAGASSRGALDTFAHLQQGFTSGGAPACGSHRASGRFGRPVGPSSVKVLPGTGRNHAAADRSPSRWQADRPRDRLAVSQARSRSLVQMASICSLAASARAATRQRSPFSGMSSWPWMRCRRSRPFRQRRNGDDAGHLYGRISPENGCQRGSRSRRAGCRPAGSGNLQRGAQHGVAAPPVIRQPPSCRARVSNTTALSTGAAAPASDPRR